MQGYLRQLTLYVLRFWIYLPSGAFPQPATCKLGAVNCVLTPDDLVGFGNVGASNVVYQAKHKTELNAAANEDGTYHMC